MSDIGRPNNTPLPSSFDNDYEFYSENTLEKIWRRLREEPLIPFGCALTVWAIVGASRSMKRGDHKMTNLYFRRRLYAQAFTIATLVAGNVYWQKDRVKRKDYEKNVAEKERKDKRDRWLRELELRDEEEKAWMDRVAKKGRSITEEVRQDAKGVTELVAAKTKEIKEQTLGK